MKPALRRHDAWPSGTRACELDGGLHRFGSGVAEKDPVEPAWAAFGETLDEFLFAGDGKRSRGSS